MDSFDFNGDGDVGFVEDYLTQELYEDDRDYFDEDGRDDYWDEFDREHGMGKYACDEYEEDEDEYEDDKEDYEAYAYSDEINEIKSRLNNLTIPVEISIKIDTVTLSDDIAQVKRREREAEILKRRHERKLREKQQRKELLESLKEPPKQMPSKKDFPNKRKYRAAYVLAENKTGYHSSKEIRKMQVRSRFIMEKADTITAANYLSCDSGFLYGQAIKEHFSLPFSLVDEDRTRLHQLPDIIKRIAKQNPELALQVWHWCLETFMPYAKYDDDAVKDMLERTTEKLRELPENVSRFFK